MIHAKAYAKINWFLQVAGKRADGYHLLKMINQRIDLYDDLAFELDESISLKTQGDVGVPTGDSNIVLRAALALKQRFGTSQGARIQLTKRIPMGAGLGGGSADAACTLLALNRLWSLNATTSELSNLALTLGADVPYCLHQEPAIVSGIGEHIRKLIPFPTYWLVLAKPEESLSTKDVFTEFAQRGNTFGSSASRTEKLRAVVRALQDGNLQALRDASHNDLFPAASSQLDSIEPLITLLYQCDAKFAQMSGAGSTVFGAFTNADAAATAYSSIQKHAPFSALVTTK